MFTSKTLKVIGLCITVLGALTGLASNVVSDKRQSIEMEEMITKAVNEKLSGQN